jgi:calcineurin-like phosphoesterase family protein
MNTWFTSDQHFDHNNIINLCNRPFADVNEMNEKIIDNHNSKVGPKDTIYFLGDVSYRSSTNRTFKILKRLNGNIKILFGNHDHKLIKLYDTGVLDKLKNVEILGYLHDFKVNKQKIILCHYAMRSWPGAFRGSWHLYGHSHGNLPGIYKSMDVGVDCNNYMPFHFDDIKVHMDNITEEFKEGESDENV